MKRVKPAVFCVESDWSRRLDDESSVRPLLETLKAVGQIDFAYRHTPTLDAFNELVSSWRQKQYSRYSIGYFAFHGSPGHIWLGHKSVSFEELAETTPRSVRGQDVVLRLMLDTGHLGRRDRPLPSRSPVPEPSPGTSET